MRPKKITIAKIIGNTPKSIENWEKEGRKILKLIYKYFSEEDLQEFISTEKIEKLEKTNTINQYDDLIIEYAIREMKKFNIDITDYGTPTSLFWGGNNECDYNLLHGVIKAIEESKNTQNFKQKIKEYTEVENYIDEEKNEKYSIIDENELEEIEIEKILKNKEKSIKKLEKFINKKRPKLYQEDIEVKPITIQL